jgi:hypothetical protein
MQFLTMLFPVPFDVVKLSDDEDDDKLADPEGDTESEKLSQTVDNPSDKPDAPRCQLRSGITASLL